MPTSITLLEGYQANGLFSPSVPAGAAGTFVGWPTTPLVGAPLGWGDAGGGSAFMSSSGFYRPIGTTPYYSHTVLLRPASEAMADQDVTLYFGPMSDFGANGTFPGVLLRYDPATGRFYFLEVFYDSSSVYHLRCFWTTLNGSSRTPIGSPAPITGSPSSSHYGAVRFIAAGSNLTGYYFDVGTSAPGQTGVPTPLSAPIGTFGPIADSTIPGTSTTRFGLMADTGFNQDLITCWRVLATTPRAAVDCFCYPTSNASVLATGSVVAMTIVGDGTAWTGATTFHVASGGSGASCGAATVTGQSATFNLTVGTLAGPIAIGNSTDAGQAAVTAVLPVPSVGALSTTANTASGLTVGWGAATGGTGPYTYYLSRWASPLSQATQPFLDPSNADAVLVGSTSGTSLLDGSPLAGNAVYRVKVVDSLGSAAFSVQGTSHRGWEDRWAGNRIIVGFVGDSLTAGVGASGGPATPYGIGTPNPGGNGAGTTTWFTNVFCATLSTYLPTYTIFNNNQGIPGTTTTAWNSGTLTSAITLMLAAGVTHVCIMLGTNDSGASVAITPAVYLNNLTAMVATLVSHGLARIQLNSPPYQVPGAGAALEWIGPGYLAQYRDGLAGIANNTTSFVGDTTLLDVTERNQSWFGDGTHFNNSGHSYCGNAQAFAFIKNFFRNAGGGSSLTRFPQVRTGGA